ncbi:VOC family protein [Marinobacterium arenosum]|uniref:VOC family protein n=1 Tax=Marinobacterium arenosum TaxID=2862496 RepID=UPI001C96D611|nr:VOC family protein [Marinobacterium arenosum]MBY4678577.1 VOC family protein [Marinobacterium arenosum]
MANKQGDFIWYELATRDPDAARDFYQAVLNWQIGEPVPGDVDYRMIAVGDECVGGVLHLIDEMCDQGAQPAWLGYIAVDDVDATLEQLLALGGHVLLPAFDVAGVGRIAMVADPQRAPFYIMRGALEDGTSYAFKPKAMGHCSWNELATSDQDGALEFYRQLFGWQSNSAIPMGEGIDYKLLDHQGVQIGAISPFMGDVGQPLWSYYFRVADIDRAAQSIAAAGGKVLHGPLEVPGGDHIVIGSDPEGVQFALVGSCGSED